MILKRLSVRSTWFALGACLAITAAASSPLSAQKPAGQNAAPKTQTGRGAAPATQNPQSPRPKPWWMDDSSKKELGLTAVQVKAIDDIYNSSKDELASYREGVDRERKELDRMIAESKVEQWVVLRQIDRMETQRVNFNKTWWMTLYRMNRQLTAEQRVKLQEMERKGRESRGGRGGSPRS